MLSVFDVVAHEDRVHADACGVEDGAITGETLLPPTLSSAVHSSVSVWVVLVQAENTTE